MKGFKDIPGYEGRYSVNKTGDVFSHYRGRMLAPARRNGYAYVCLWKRNKQVSFRIHRLVLLTFIGLKPLKMVSDHKNRNVSDNSVENLRYVTRGQNNHNRACANRNGFKGIQRLFRNLEKPWSAEIKSNGKHLRSHYFRTPKEAALEYDRMAIRIYGPDATTNKSLGLL